MLIIIQRAASSKVYPLAPAALGTSKTEAIPLLSSSTADLLTILLGIADKYLVPEVQRKAGGPRPAGLTPIARRDFSEHQNQ
jgi:hypothetical protein